MPAIALDLGGTRIKFGLLEAGQLQASANIEVPSSENFAAVLPIIEEQIAQMLQQTGHKNLNGIGMAFPTVVDSDNMRLLYKYVKYNDANDLDLSDWARKKWQAPLVMENDARAALVGEWQYGAGKGCDNLVMVTIGTGVGSAALIEGKLLKGSHYLAGNLGGHQNIRFDGIRCNCGNTGCLESEASSWALPEMIKREKGYEQSPFATGEKPDFEAVFRLAAAGDPFALQVRNRCLEVWSAGILNLIYAYDPERVVIGGGVMHSASVILPFIQEKINTAAWLPENAAQVVAAQQPDWAGVMGIGYLATVKSES
jgi:glucokinase